MKINELHESHMTCPECGGPAFSDLMLAEKQDACYHKVKSRYKVWPSAYASGALVQCRKKGAANWGNKSKNEDVAEGQEVDVSVVVGKLYDIIDHTESMIKNADFDRQVQYATTVRDRAVKALNMIKTNPRAANSAWKYFQSGQQGVAEGSQQYHVVSKLDGNVLASYKTREDAQKNAHGNPVVSGSLETIGDRQYVREQGVAEGSVDHRALGKHHEEMTDQELRKVGSKLPDSWDAAVFRRKLASHPKYAQALKHYDKSEYHFGKAARQGVAEDYNAEYDDEAGMAQGSLHTLKNAVEGLSEIIDSGDNLPEWCQEKISLAEDYLVTVWDYIQSEKAQGIDPEITEEFDMIERIIESIAAHNGVDAEVVWTDLESLTEDELYAFAVTSQLNEDWSKVNKKDKTDGMSRKAVKAYRRENPGSKLQTAVTTKPSKLKKGSKASKRRKSYCSRSRGQMKMHNISCAKTPDKAICKARRRWNC